MPLYFIEMGQGIIADSNDLRVITSALHSCTFIAGFTNRSKANFAGAFHYPAESLKVRYEYDEDIRLSEDGTQVEHYERTRGAPIHDQQFRTRNEIVNDMTDWARALRPTSIVLAHGSQIGDKDLRKVKRWIAGHCPNVTSNVRVLTAAAMTVADGKLLVGSPIDLEAKCRAAFTQGQIDLQSASPRRYADYMLFGRKR